MADLYLSFVLLKIINFHKNYHKVICIWYTVYHFFICNLSNHIPWINAAATIQPVFSQNIPNKLNEEIFTFSVFKHILRERRFRSQLWIWKMPVSLLDVPTWAHLGHDLGCSLCPNAIFWTILVHAAKTMINADNLSVQLIGTIFVFKANKHPRSERWSKNVSFAWSLRKPLNSKALHEWSRIESPLNEP